MRSTLRRHILPLLHPATGARLHAALAARGAPEAPLLPPELSWRDYAIMLLFIAAEIEHALMVQYLYAAYSLGGPQVPPEHREEVRGWQEVILGIAKEEMGHLITVQNVLRLIGGPFDLGREDYPWDSEFYPFKFRLEPLTLKSLSKYVYVESPAIWSSPPAAEVKRLATEAAGDDCREDGLPAVDEESLSIHRVGELYTLMIEVVKTRLSDADFNAETFDVQASFAEWGRNYSGGARGNSGAGPKHTPDVIVRQLASRDDAVAALQAIADQGEARKIDQDDDQTSHFYRFLQIWKRLALVKEWSPARPVPTNPRTPREGDAPDGGTDITNPESEAWAHIFNVRYRLLLGYLSHAFRMPTPSGAEEPSNARGYLIGATFGEMYNLRALAGILVQSPLAGDATLAAGPTFEMPYTTSLPDNEPDRFRLHRDLLRATGIQIHELLVDPQITGARREYLRALAAADARALEMIAAILNDHGKKGRGR